MGVPAGRPLVEIGAGLRTSVAGRTHVVVECFGMPGAGKSQVARALARLLRERGVHVRDERIRISEASRPHRAVRKLGYLVRAIPFWLSRSTLLRGRDPGIRWRTPYRGLKVLSNWAFVVSLVRAQLQREGVPVLDQGFLQGLWSTDYHSREGLPGDGQLQSCLELALELAGDPRVILVVVEAPESRIRKRLRARKGGVSPLDHEETGREVWRAARSATARILELADRFAAGSRQVSVVHLENSGDGLSAATLDSFIGDKLLPLLPNTTN